MAASPPLKGSVEDLLDLSTGFPFAATEVGTKVILSVCLNDFEETLSLVVLVSATRFRPAIV